jgi:hypothetical protein
VPTNLPVLLIRQIAGGKVMQKMIIVGTAFARDSNPGARQGKNHIVER